MRDSKAIVVGDKVDLKVTEIDFCPVTVGDISRSGLMYLSEPSIRGVPYPLHAGEEYSLFFYRENNRYAVQVRVIGYNEINGLRQVKLEQISSPRKEQRREFYRLPTYLKTLVCQYSENAYYAADMRNGDNDEEVAFTNDISIAGISLRARQKYSVGERLQLKIYLGWPNDKAPPIIVIAEVRRVIKLQERGEYQVGFRFIELTNAANDSITKFVIFQQQKRIRQRKLVEGD